MMMIAPGWENTSRPEQHVDDDDDEEGKMVVIIMFLVDYVGFHHNMAPH